jgi:tRNA (adenine-N(1)-)-methyltransferase non-catalytic subunit
MQYWPGTQGADYNNAEIRPIGKSGLQDRRCLFFAAGFQPGQKGNKTAYAAAEKRAWPVLLAWTHFDDSGAVQDSAGWLSCSKATASKETVDTSGATVSSLLDLAVGMVFVIWFTLAHLFCGFG